jgi:hypothetical protein
VLSLSVSLFLMSRMYCVFVYTVLPLSLSSSLFVSLSPLYSL